MLSLLVVALAAAYVEGCACPMGRRLLFNPADYTCDSYGEGYEMVPEQWSMDCADGSTINCSGPYYVCTNGEQQMPALDVQSNDSPSQDTEDCMCPAGRRRMVVNPDLFSCACYGEGFQLEPEQVVHYCPGGAIKYCSGPGWTCSDGEDTFPALDSGAICEQDSARSDMGRAEAAVAGSFNAAWVMLFLAVAVAGGVFWKVLGDKKYKALPTEELSPIAA